jgi:type I restriction enzyme S subunit
LPVYVLEAGDIVFARKGAVDRSAWVKPEQAGWFLGSDGIRLRLPYTCDSRFIAYQLQSETHRSWLLQQATGTTMASLNQATLERLPLVLPPIDEQRAITRILGALDDKIESNGRLVADVRLLALHELQVGASGASLFRLGDIADVRKGLSYKGAGLVDGQDALPMISLATFGRDGWFDRASLKPYSGAYQPKHLVTGGDLVVANTDLTQQRAILGRPALVPEDVTSALFTHHVYAIRPHEPGLAVAIWAALNTAVFRERAEGYATGTTVAGLPKDAILDFEFPTASISIRETAMAMLRRAWKGEAESASLSSLRKAVMPELLSGRLHAPTPRRSVEAVQ